MARQTIETECYWCDGSGEGTDGHGLPCDCPRCGGSGQITTVKLPD